MQKTALKFALLGLILSLGVAGGVSAVLADSDNGGGDSRLAIQGPSTMVKGTRAQFTAYFNGKKVKATWSLASNAYAAINSSGLLTAKSVSQNQSVTVRATYRLQGETYSTTQTVNIAYEDTNTLTIRGPTTVPQKTKAQYTAYFNGQQVVAAWRLSSTAYATINSSGLLTAKAVKSNKTVTVRASYRYNGKTYYAYQTVTISAATAPSLTSLTVTGATSVNSGSSATYTATAYFSDNSSQNVTANANWAVSPTVGTISGGVYSPGQVTANQTVTVQANYTTGGVTKSGSITVTVAAPAPTVTLTGVTVTGPSSVNSGSSANYTATATFSNGSTQNVTSGAAWSLNPQVGTIATGTYSPGTVTTSQTVTISAGYTYGGVTKSGSTTVTVNASTASSGSYQVFAFNDLGMHCYDADFSEFAVLPLYNVLRAQVVQKGATPSLVNNLNLTYQGIADPTGSLNTTSSGSKTNFWTYAQQLFGMMMPMDMGIKGQKMPGMANTPQNFLSPYDTTMNWYGAEGIPITAYDDAMKFNPESMMRVSATDPSTGATLSYLDTVVPASNEMNCSNCHVTGGEAANSTIASKYAITTAWSTNSNMGNQTKENVMILHDALNHTTLMASRPVLCSSCHYSKALDLNNTGPTGAQLSNKYMSRAMHQHHGLTMNGTVPTATDPAIVSGSGGTSACYQCHPGANTKCMRGAMATAGMSCENCHGDLLAVGGYYNLASTGAQRQPWADLPKCQSCHTGDATSHLGTALIGTQAYASGDPAATPIVATNTRFAEANATTLYRFSTGHGGLACESCHGSTHAEWPTSNANDNIAATQIQGHSGVIIECTACHGTGLSRTTGGPHGMHNVNDSKWWNGGHDSYLGTNGANCKTCHGTDGLGTALSEAKADRTFGSHSIKAGTPVACNMCHSNYINGGG